MTISEFLNENLNGASLYSIHKTTGISQNNSASIFKDKTEPKAKMLFRIVKALQIPPEKITAFALQYMHEVKTRESS